jgi:hypothetical protein
VHGTNITQFAKGTSPVTVQRSAPVVSHRMARLLDYATVHGTYTDRSLQVRDAKSLLHLSGCNRPWFTPLAPKGLGLLMSPMVLGDTL